jgi:hypothetical protein
MKGTSQIIADGACSARLTQYRAARAKLIAEARMRYERELREASLWTRLKLELRIRREVSAALRKKFPLFALYANGGLKIRA